MSPNKWQQKAMEKNDDRHCERILFTEWKQRSPSADKKYQSETFQYYPV